MKVSSKQEHNIYNHYWNRIRDILPEIQSYNFEDSQNLIRFYIASNNGRKKRIIPVSDGYALQSEASKYRFHVFILVELCVGESLPESKEIIYKANSRYRNSIGSFY